MDKDDEDPDQQKVIKKGQEDIMSLIMQIGDAAGSQKLDEFPAIFDEMEAIVGRTGVDVPGLTDQMAALRDGTAQTQEHFDNQDAAMWVGDLERARVLQEQGPQVDLSAMLGDQAGVETEFAGDEDWADDVVEEVDFAALAEEFGIDVAAFEPPKPDHFADIAAGKAGAIDAAIASGIDLNLVCGEGYHTALLAALDGPGRRVEHLHQLVAAGADTQVVHGHGDTALSWAQGYHHPDTVTAASETEIMQFLVAQGCDPNFRIEGMWTTLQRAIIQGDGVRVSALLSTGAEIEIDVFEAFEPAFLRGTTPVMLAAPKPDSVAVLLAAGADAARPDVQGRNQRDWIASQLDAARNRASDNDPWTVTFAENLARSLALVEAHLDG